MMRTMMRVVDRRMRMVRMRMRLMRLVRWRRRRRSMMMGMCMRMRMDLGMGRRMGLHKRRILPRERRRLLSARLAFGLGGDETNSLLSGCLGCLLRSQGGLSLFHGTSHVSICPAA